MWLSVLSFLYCTYKSNMFDFSSPPSVSAAWLSPALPRLCGPGRPAPAPRSCHLPLPARTPSETHVPGARNIWDSVSYLIWTSIVSCGDLYPYSLFLLVLYR